VDHFFVCVDAEELTFEARHREIADEIARWERETAVREGNPTFRSHVIVQSCCIETWFLGHRKMMRRSPTSPLLAEYRRFYDVRESDPEHMGAYRGFSTRARFHQAYLQEMLLDQNPRLRYSKVHPGSVLDRDYLDALRERVASTDHLRSLKRLFEIWDTLGEVRSSPSAS